MNKRGITGEITMQYCAKFPTAKTLALARKMYKENSKVFSTVDAARNSIMYYRGIRGSKHRKSLKNKSLVHDLTYNTNRFDLPESYADSFEPYKIKQERILILSDFHFPYQHNKSIELALEFGKKQKVSCILINGDLIDFATISRHEKDFRSRSVAEEFEAVRTFLKALRKNFPKTKIVYKFGNHDERWEKWLYVKAPEIFDVSDFRLEILLRLGELGIEVVKDKRPVQVGKLTVLHGHELAGGSGGVNPARATFLKTLDSVVVGHYHKSSQHTETSMMGNVISVDSVGCLCGLNPQYMPINKWNLGFAFVELNIKTGEYQLYNKKIIKGKVY